MTVSPDPLTVSPEVHAGATSTRTEADATFDAWLRTQPQLRRFIAEQRDPGYAKAALKLAFMGGCSEGFRDGVKTALGFDPASGVDGLLKYVEGICRPPERPAGERA